MQNKKVLTMGGTRTVDESVHGLTIYSIASIAGVSVTTVSRVLNGNENVKPETRQRVEEVIRQYGYVPHQKARNYYQTVPFAVGLMIEDIRNSYMSELAYSIDTELSKWRVSTVLCNISNVEREFISQMDNLISKKVNGVILMGSIFRSKLCRTAIERRYQGYPFVSINGSFGLPNVYEIMLEQRKGVKDAAAYLYGLGRRHIGYVYCRKSPSDEEKYIGFINAVHDFHLPENLLSEVQAKTAEDGEKAMQQLLMQDSRLDAVIFSSDYLAVGGVHYCHRNQLKIPEQMAIVGFNNSVSAKECYPPLTSVDNSIARSGQVAAEAIMKVLSGQTPEDEVIPCSLVIRESTEGKMNRKMVQNEETQYCISDSRSDAAAHY